jgi:hypothetical protein
MEKTGVRNVGKAKRIIGLLTKTFTWFKKPWYKGLKTLKKTKWFTKEKILSKQMIRCCAFLFQSNKTEKFCVDTLNYLKWTVVGLVQSSPWTEAVRLVRTGLLAITSVYTTLSSSSFLLI